MEVYDEERYEVICEHYKYDLFEVCPACHKWRMRVRIEVKEHIGLGGAVVWLADGDWYAYDMRCLNCGYSNRILELDPLTINPEEELEGVLTRERRQLVDKMAKEMRGKVERGEAVEVNEANKEKEATEESE